MASRPTSNCTSILVVRESFLPRTDRSEKISQMGREDRGRNKGLVSTVVRRGFTPFLFHEVEEGSSPGYVHSCSGEKFVHRPSEERKKRVFPNVFRCPTSRSTPQSLANIIEMSVLGRNALGTTASLVPSILFPNRMRWLRSLSRG